MGILKKTALTISLATICMGVLAGAATAQQDRQDNRNTTARQLSESQAHNVGAVGLIRIDSDDFGNELWAAVAEHLGI